MKKLFLICIIIYLSSSFGFSEETKTLPKDTTKNLFVSAGVVLSHFIPTDAATDLDWKTQVLSPGGEVLFGYKFNNKLSLMTGLNYQYSKISLSHFYYGDRTFHHEISFPFLINYNFLNKSKSKYFLNTGINLTKFSHIKREIKGGKILSDSNKWYELDNDIFLNLFSDVYLSLSYFPYSSTFPIYFEIFSKYRLNDYWINSYVDRFSYGIKVNYQLNF